MLQLRKFPSKKSDLRDATQLQWMKEKPCLISFQILIDYQEKIDSSEKFLISQIFDGTFKETTKFRNRLDELRRAISTKTRDFFGLHHSLDVRNLP